MALGCGWQGEAATILSSVVGILRNPADFARALEPFYGRQIAAEFERLLTEHLVIAAERQVLMMADVMTRGIVRQFPRRFL